MNPTEYFIAELSKLLEKHDTDTGTYIELIRIDRLPAARRNDRDLRAKRLIREINLEIK